MGFFKEFKDDISQAVNEMLPDAGQKQADAEDQMVNTLDPEDPIRKDSSENDMINEWLDEFSQNDSIEEVLDRDEKIEDTVDTDTIEIDTVELEPETNENGEGNDMEDNVDLEVLSVLNTDQEVNEDKDTKAKNQDNTKLKAASVACDDETTVITKGTTINGNMSTDASLEVMGTINGDVETLGKISITGKVLGNVSAAEVYINTDRLMGSVTSEGSVKIALGTVVIGDVMGSSGVIAGAVKGEIDIDGPVVIDSTAIIKGNIKAKSIQVNNGAVIEGFCSLAYASVDIDNIFE